MKKLIAVLIFVFVLTGCSSSEKPATSNNSITEAVNTDTNITGTTETVITDTTVETTPEITTTPVLTATPIPTETPTTETNQYSKQGDIITLGSYEQDNNLSNGKEPIEWIVLSNDGEKVLLLSKYALDSKNYHDEKNFKISWADCTLRTWLNDTFYNTAFNEEEKQCIKTTHLSNNDNPQYHTAGGSDTDDKVFLLAIEDVVKELGWDPEYKLPLEIGACLATEYAMAQGIEVPPYVASSIGTNSCSWWLRSMGYQANVAATVEYAGTINAAGYYACGHSSTGVRPAMYITLK